MDRIRPIVIGIIINDNKIFVFEGKDEIKGETFYRPLGGSIEFGERAEEALMREFNEEINAELADIKYLTTLENIFTYRGQAHHEIVLIYKGEFKDESFYDDTEFIGYEDDGSSFKCLWLPLQEFIDKESILYPDGLLEMLKPFV